MIDEIEIDINFGIHFKNDPCISPLKYRVLYVSSISFKVLGIKDKLKEGIIANFWGNRVFSSNLDKSEGFVKIMKIEKIKDPAEILNTSKIDRIGPPKKRVITKVSSNNGKIPLRRFKQFCAFLV